MDTWNYILIGGLVLVIVVLWIIRSRQSQS